MKVYKISKRMEIAGAHRLHLSYDSKCHDLHGHNWVVTVYMRADELNSDGMIMDFKHVKEKIHDKFDHKFINEVVPHLNPTAENLAEYFMSLLPYDEARNSYCYKIEVQETKGNVASCEIDSIEEFLDLVKEMSYYEHV